MNSGKYLYKTSKKITVPKEKTFIYFDENIVKYISKFLDKLADLECIYLIKLVEKTSQLRKKKNNIIDNVSLKLFSDDTLGSKLPSSILFIKSKNVKKLDFLRNQIMYNNN